MSIKEEVIKIHREKLYKQVWKVPISRLAPKYGLSDVGLSKICRKLKVPKPPRGYWTKLKFGKKVTRIPLPKLNHGDPYTYTISIQTLSDKIPQSNSKINNIVIAENKSKKQVTVSKKLKFPHLFVKETRKILEELKPDDYGVLCPFGRMCLNIRVSPRSLNRALRIMDALIKEFESRGFKVSTEAGQISRIPSTYVEILGEKIHFSLCEKVQRVDHVPFEKEIKGQEKYSWMTPRRWDYIATGKLSLNIEVWGAYGKRKRWSDSSTKCVEDQLNDFIIGAVMIAEVLRQERLEREEEKKKWEEEQRRIQEEAKRRKAEEECLRDLENQAEQWAKSQQLRAYIQAVEKVASAQQCSKDFQKRIEKWLSWAREHADRLDPLKRGLSFKDDPLDSSY